MVRAHSDHVGSLLRPPELLRAREAFARRAIGAAELKAKEDRAVDRVIALQEAAGCEVVTDGEFRRLSFQSQIPEAVEGFGEWNLDAFLWGDWYGDELPPWRRRRPENLGVVSPLRRKRSIAAEELTYLRPRTRRIAKITLPSPSLFANFWSAERSRQAYSTLDAFLEAMAEILSEEVVELERLGCPYIQIDAPHYTLLLDPKTRAFYEGQGWSWERWLARGIELDNVVIASAPKVSFGFHLCRGNQASRWLVAGDYEPIARLAFPALRADRLLLEYDDERAGDFRPLRHVPDDRMVVLGLVTTKSPRLESIAELTGRIREAARVVELERLAVSPQCGFATSILGNALDEEDEAAKLRLVSEAAGAIWS